ncbi:MAG: hypothetical protein OXC68_00415 [Aestuariivita sp.]|nr:hypothetical protein [Aestuariivita sp.]
MLSVVTHGEPINAAVPHLLRTGGYRERAYERALLDLDNFPEEVSHHLKLFNKKISRNY